MAKRERLEIIKDILEIIKSSHNKIKLTPLLRKSNLSTSRFKEYYDELTQKGLIIENIDKDEKKTMSLTDKGKRYVEKYFTILKFIEEFDL